MFRCIKWRSACLYRVYLYIFVVLNHEKGVITAYAIANTKTPESIIKAPLAGLF